MRVVKLPYFLPEHIIFKVASSKSELEQAFRLVYDSYVEVNLQKPFDAELRVTPYHSLHSTSTLIAKDLNKDKVIGTMTVIRKGALGLPSEQLVSLDERVQLGYRLAEMSSLAIDPSYRGQILFPLIKYASDFCIHHFGIDEIIAVVTTDKMAHLFYESVFLYTRVDKKIFKNYEFANCKNVVVEALNLKFAQQEYRKVYGQLPLNKNLSYFFREAKFSNFIFPKKKTNVISDTTMDKELYKYFFNQKTKANFQIPDKIRQYIETNLDKRSGPERMDVSDIRGVLIDTTNENFNFMNLRDISTSGFRAHLKKGCSLNSFDPITFYILLDSEEGAVIHGKIAWQDDSGHIGVAISEKSQKQWNKIYTMITQTTAEAA